MSEKIHITNQLARAVRDSRLLLSYTAQTGLSLDEKMVEVLVNAQYRVDFDEWTNEDEADFWEAFSELHVLIKPVSLESLKAVSLVHTRTFRFRFLRFFNNAYRTAAAYVVLTLFFMGLLLGVQIYWLVGQKFSNDLSDFTRQAQQLSQLEGFDDGKYTEEYNTLMLQIETTRVILLYWSNPRNRDPFSPTNEEQYQSLTHEDYRTQIQTVQTELQTITRHLTLFKDFGTSEEGSELKNVYQEKVDRLIEHLNYLKTAYEKEQNTYVFTEMEMRTRYVLHVLQRYILPLLYGLLGASAYVLRSLINQIHQETYTGNAWAEYALQLFLGALAGVVIGFFIIPKEMSGLGMLPPMALSFLVGYNVDVLFSVMDRLIVSASQALRPRGSREAKQTKSEE